MKNIVLILLISIYSFSTFGISLNGFYCCGKLKTVSVTFVEESKAKCNTGDNTDGCCKTKSQTLKGKDKHLIASELTAPVKNNFEKISLFSFLNITPTTSHKVVIIIGNHAPPLYAGVPIYIANRFFRI